MDPTTFQIKGKSYSPQDIVVIFDIDGTTIQVNKRAHLMADWDMFNKHGYLDDPIESTVLMAQMYYRSGVNVRFHTARLETSRDDTLYHLRSILGWRLPEKNLSMRTQEEADAKIPHSQVKARMLEEVAASGLVVVAVYEDDLDAYRMYVKKGLVCYLIRHPADNIEGYLVGGNFLVRPAGTRSAEDRPSWIDTSRPHIVEGDLE